MASPGPHQGLTGRARHPRAGTTAGSRAATGATITNQHCSLGRVPCTWHSPSSPSGGPCLAQGSASIGHAALHSPGWTRLHVHPGSRVSSRPRPWDVTGSKAGPCAPRPALGRRGPEDQERTPTRQRRSRTGNTKKIHCKSNLVSKEEDGRQVLDAEVLTAHRRTECEHWGARVLVPRVTVPVGTSHPPGNRSECAEQRLFLCGLYISREHVVCGDRSVKEQQTLHAHTWHTCTHLTHVCTNTAHMFTQHTTHVHIAHTRIHQTCAHTIHVCTHYTCEHITPHACAPHTMCTHLIPHMCTHHMHACITPYTPHMHTHAHHVCAHLTHTCTHTTRAHITCVHTPHTHTSHVHTGLNHLLTNTHQVTDCSCVNEPRVCAVS